MTAAGWCGFRILKNLRSQLLPTRCQSQRKRLEKNKCDHVSGPSEPPGEVPPTARRLCASEGGGSLPASPCPQVDSDWLNRMQ
ncbi:hypothetical protein NQZ68_016820 [Dissostichus eleginoides]|nr:hypothetical protein NQZ68_016820 [Dissostichus eleginoides]